MADFAPVVEVRPQATFGLARKAGLIDWGAFWASSLFQILTRGYLLGNNENVATVLFLASFLIPALLIAYLGRSLGGLMTGTRVERDNGRHPGMLRAGFSRFLLPLLFIFAAALELDDRYQLVQRLRLITPRRNDVVGALLYGLFGLCLYGVPFVLYALLMRPSARRWIDRVTGTRVVDLRQRPSRPA